MNRSRLPKNSQEADTHDAPQEKFWRAWRWWLAPALVALTLALCFVDAFIGDWDGLDYTVLALRGEPSSMALGRMLFIYANHALYGVAHALFHLQPKDAYLLFKYSVVAESPLAVIACWILAHDLTRRREAATVAALFVALSPVFVIYSGQVMTDVPSVLIVVVALIFYGRGLRKKSLTLMLAGALLLGAGVNVREPAAFFALWLLLGPFVYGWRFGRREIFCVALACLVFVLSAFGAFAYLFWMSESYRAAWNGWRETMSAEAARHPVTVRNLLPFLSFFFLTAPLLVARLPLALIEEWRERRLTPLLALALVGLFADLLLFFNYSTAINIRYFLTGLPALAPLVADNLMRSQTLKFQDARRAFWTIALSIAFITVLMGAFTYLMGTEYQ
ncbi:MAG: glycosyltransferase family 39 protein, partial [Pyrinomonadaceae bacterium]